MAEKSTLARPYALAVFAQAREEDAIDRWSEMIDLLVLVRSDPLMGKIMVDPRVSADQLAKWVIAITEGRLSKTGKNFVKVLADAERMGLIREIARLFKEECDNFDKRSRVEVFSPYPLAQTHRKTIEKIVAKWLGRTVTLEVAVDKSLIGGIVIRAGDRVIDLSLSARLAGLARALA